MPTVKPILHPLKTPKSASFPSELHSDSSSSPSDLIKQEELCTPITPDSSIPKAYTQFLEAMTPVFSPVSAGVNFPKFPLKRPSPPTSQPASAMSGSFSFSDSVRSPTVSLPPPTPASAQPSRKNFAHPRRLRIPHSAKYSPCTDSPKSATMLRSPFTPSGWNPRYFEGPHSANPCGKPVSVRQVVTRTVTYKRTQLEAPPKGKRRKCRDIKEVKEVKEGKEVS
ncbi:hypothetical protein N7509_013495 [Penicillium cosmopolitanum]|uniref:Uncharacterized protein n=1 Tax=Penicillium cosmopolitanum TaxID=1131564 RepID=A0A9W9SG46_9EURO|nr:uncharacterized protein N7509_013495 [Penicillium cosmopolitanum]KAJ5376609.1 hypothetical protein N7509_013495 [Penicillium cosmopolitanum]